MRGPASLVTILSAPGSTISVSVRAATEAETSDDAAETDTGADAPASSDTPETEMPTDSEPSETED